jgi:hypothetical protein
VKRAPAEYTFEARGKGPEAKGKFVFPNAYRLMPIAYDRPCSPEKLLIYELETLLVPSTCYAICGWALLRVVPRNIFRLRQSF